MLTEALKNLFSRDFDRLKAELTAYADESDLWLVKGAISNSAGNLTLHLLGNVRHFIGHVLGKTDYTRNRPAEFELKDVPLADILKEIDEAKTEINTALDGLNAAALENIYPINVLGYDMTTAFFLVHLHGHFNYHLGQVNYHRRLVAEK